MSKMKAAATPGPWELVLDGWETPLVYGMDERITNSGAAGRRFIASVSNVYDGAEANAALIAASPDLAAALLAILAEVTSSTVTPFSGDSYLPVHLIEQARAALEKAGAV